MIEMRNERSCSVVKLREAGKKKDEGTGEKRGGANLDVCHCQGFSRPRSLAARGYFKHRLTRAVPRIIV